MSRKWGQSLPELLVCIATLVPALLILVGMFPVAYGMDHRAWDQLNAQEVARTQLEILRASDFDGLGPSHSQQTRGATVFVSDVQVAPWPAGQTVVRQKKAVVTVTWSGKQLQLETLLFKWAP